MSLPHPSRLLAAQDKKLPLHYAAEKGALAEVVKLLLDANKSAATAKDEVHRAPQAPPHAAAPWLCAAARSVSSA